MKRTHEIPVRNLVRATIAAATLLLPARGALAEFSVCNRTLDVVNLAFSQEIDNAFQTEGWWTVGANQCVKLISGDLVNRYIYVFATDVFGQAILDRDASTTEMCTEPRRRFLIRGTEDCWQRGYKAASFHEVDTRDQARWTFFLSASP